MLHLYPNEQHPNIIQKLSTFLTEERVEKIDNILRQRTNYLAVALEDIYQAQNASAVLRTCECFGVQNVYIIENNNKYDINPMVLKGSDKWLNLHRLNKDTNNSLHAINLWKEQGYRIVTTTLSNQSITPDQLDLTQGKIVLVLGNEHDGISPIMQEHADIHLKIPMAGFTQSLNVSAAAAILIAYFTQKIREFIPNHGLTEQEINTLKLHWLYKCVPNARLILQRYFPLSE